MTTEERLEKIKNNLKKRSKWKEAGDRVMVGTASVILCYVANYAFFHQPNFEIKGKSFTGDHIKVRQISVVDREGRERVMIGSGGNLTLKDRMGRNRISLYGGEGETHMLWRDEKDKERVWLRADNSGHTSLELKNGAGKNIWKAP